ncbi:ATP-binding protein [Streptomyces sp. NRRL WC-3742]|uniref:ATP-binding protein n=1 Tax=Streptomyces sp. NRRL WC-3742 TaxID=1463934 RepID=UPI0004CAF873|nr:ATP-binding protein [Streptomyces sp. NRRL WC-3742]
MRKTKRGARRGSRLFDEAGTPAAAAEPTPWQLNRRVVAPRKGWPGAASGRAAHVDRGAVYLGTTDEVAGIFPYVLGAPLPTEGIPIGPDLLTNELVCFDPAGWVGRLVQNPGVWVQGQPGCGKSALVKRICLVYSSYGFMILVPGDVKGEYRVLVEGLGGQVVRIGRGLDKINPLDSGPLRGKLAGLRPDQRETLLAEINGRRAELLHALLATPHGLGRRPTAAESNVVGAAVSMVAERLADDPVVPDVVAVLREGPAELWSRLLVDTVDDYRAQVREVTLALENLCAGPLAGLFDGPTTRPLDLTAPAVSVDLSSLLTAGDQVVATGLLATWSYSYGAIDSARALGMMDRPLVLPLDEMWRALRAGPGMVDAMDAMTRLNRAKGEVTLFVTHSLRDPESLSTPEDRAKALGLMERCDSLVLGALSRGELERVNGQKPLTSEEIALVGSWSAPGITGVDGTTQRHPGRGKYLIKIGTRAGSPARLDLTEAEIRMYDTDTAMRRRTSSE